MPHRYVTPTLYVVEQPTASVTVADAVTYIQTRCDGRPTGRLLVADAYRVLRALGLSAEEARHRINFARTGDMYATRTAARRRQQRPALHGG